MLDLLDMLDGAVDLHTHSGPSPFPRRLDHAEAGRQAEQAGFRAIVVKSHHHPTVMDVRALQNWGLKDVRTQVFGGIALNSAVGGLNPAAVDLALKMGGKVVWFPTISSPQHIRHHAEHANLTFPKPSVPLMKERPNDVFGPDGDLRPEVSTILGQALEAGAIVSAGHMGPDSCLAVFELAHRMGLRRLLVSHPNFVIEASRATCSRLADLGATIEHCLCMYDEDSEFFQGWSTHDLVEWIELTGPDRTTLGSDLGQINNPLPMDAFRKICGRLLDAGVNERDLRRMLTNGARLLGLE